MLPIFASFLLSFAPSSKAQCLAPSITTFVQSGQATVTISEGTYADVESGGTASFLRCATGVVRGGAFGQGSSATIDAVETGGSPSFATLLASGAPLSVPFGISAEITGRNAARVTIDDFFYGKINGLSGASVTAAGGFGGDYTAQGGTISAYASNILGVSVGGYGLVDITQSDDGFFTATAGADGELTWTGNSVLISASSGTATMFGYSGTCFAEASGNGDAMTVTAVLRGLGAVQGNSAFITVSEGGTGYAGPGASGYGTGADSHLTFDSEASGVVDTGAVGIVSSAAGTVRVRAQATAYLLLSAIVTANPAATVTAYSPATQIVSIDERPNGIVYQAQLHPSFARRRAQMPMRTSTCSFGLIECPNIRGGTDCVDPKVNINNCGGCTLLGKGLDCTGLTDGDTACVRGKCMA